jgi:ABC-type cobalamin/Fe3+-siderophores transport system ATPase subunit
MFENTCCKLINNRCTISRCFFYNKNIYLDCSPDVLNSSGLDAASAFFVMDAISKLAKQGRTILTVIHQPSSEVLRCYIYLISRDT